MKKNFLIATGLVFILQLVVISLTTLGLYIQNEMHRFTNDVGIAVALTFFCGYPVFLYFLNQRSKLIELNAVLKDATKRANEADIAKSEFLANMSHEIRTPMNGVMGMAELLVKTELTDKQKMFADVIIKSGSSLLMIINDVLDFSKIESGQLKLDSAPFDLKEVVEDVAALLSPKFAEKNVELVVRISPVIPDVVVGDNGRIRQLLVNFLGNAAKFTETGHVFLDLSGKICEKGACVNLEFSIEDTGIGISKENCTRVFEKFNQADASATRNFEGTGLGLSICSSLVKLMDGKIGVDSELGDGSTFWFEIQLPVIGEAVKRHQTSIDIAGSRVLIVDDNAINRSILLEQMKLWNMDAEQACSGEEALAMANRAAERNAGYNLIILDYQMSGMTGGDAAKEFKAVANLRDIPIILLTSVDETDDGLSFASLGIASYLTKPARSSLLLKQITQALEDARKRVGFVTGELPVTSDTGAGEMTDTTEQDEQIDILVAEDNEVNQIVFTQILEATNWRFMIAENGAQAVEFNKRYQPKMILMDISMPVMNGREACRVIRSQEQASDVILGVPIIAVTAHAVSGDKQKCFDAGMDDYLAKPVSPQILEAKIDHWMAEIVEREFSLEHDALLFA